MGESLAALRAGKTPNTTPIIEDTTIAIKIATKFKLAGKKNLIIQTIIAEITSPATPPKSDKIMDSDKN